MSCGSYEFHLSAFLRTRCRNMLKMRFVAPESAADHRMAWAYLHQLSLPYRQRFPMLERLVQFAKAWFLNVR